MTPNNNLSVLPFYESIDEQNARRWWVYGKVYPLFCPVKYAPAFQVIVPYTGTTLPTYINGNLFKADGTDTGTITSAASSDIGSSRKEFGGQKFCVFTYKPSEQLKAVGIGRYYLRLQFSVDGSTKYYYSDVFTMVDDITNFLALSWWDDSDFVMDAGAIVYSIPSGQGQFKNTVYLPSDIAKPEYPFEEEGETRDGYFYPLKQISQKKYRFNFFAPEYLLDVLRFVRMADHIQIDYNGKTFAPDSFLLSPEWDESGDIAVVSAEFETDTVAKKIGMAYTRSV